jgi:Low temperature viability protein
MGRKKPFIDKKRAVTYTLVHRDAEDDDGGDDSAEYELVTQQEMAEQQVKAAAAARSKHPLAFLYTQEEDLVENEQQRTEILDLGLLDDGYNYLKHLRAPGARAVAISAQGTSGAPQLDAQQILDGEI